MMPGMTLKELHLGTYALCGALFLAAAPLAACGEDPPASKDTKDDEEDDEEDDNDKPSTGSRDGGAKKDATTSKTDEDEDDEGQTPGVGDNPFGGAAPEIMGDREPGEPLESCPGTLRCVDPLAALPIPVPGLMSIGPICTSGMMGPTCETFEDCVDMGLTTAACVKISVFGMMIQSCQQPCVASATPTGGDAGSGGTSGDGGASKGDAGGSKGADAGSSKSDAGVADAGRTR
jgi:hypothetical protein